MHIPAYGYFRDGPGGTGKTLILLICKNMIKIICHIKE